MALKFPRLQVIKIIPAGPRALILLAKNLALVIHRNSSRRAQAAAGGDDPALGRDAQAPAAKAGFAGERAGEGEQDPEISILVELAHPGVFVVIAADAPVVAKRFIDVRMAPAIGVLQTRDLAALDGIEKPILGVVRQPHHFMHAGGPPGKMNLLRIGRQRIFQEIDIAPSRRDGQCSVWEELHSSAFEHDIAGDWDAFDPVVFVLGRVGRRPGFFNLAPHVGQIRNSIAMSALATRLRVREFFVGWAYSPTISLQ